MSTVDELIVAANAHYTAAQNHLRSGDWAAYGTEMDALQATLTQLVRLTGGVPAEATPAPDAEATPALDAEATPAATD